MRDEHDCIGTNPNSTVELFRKPVTVQFKLTPSSISREWLARLHPQLKPH